MTVIAVKIENDKIILGGDEMVTSSMKYNIKDHRTTKLHKISDDFAFGGAGDCADLGLFSYYALSHQPRAADIVSVTEYLHDFAEWKSKRGRDYNCDGVYLIIVFKGHVFRTLTNSVYAIDRFAAIGSGGDFAHTALHLGHTVQEAIKVAAELDIYCGGEVQIIEMAVAK